MLAEIQYHVQKHITINNHYIQSHGLDRAMNADTKASDIRCLHEPVLVVFVSPDPPVIKSVPKRVNRHLECNQSNPESTFLLYSANTTPRVNQGQ